VYVKSLCVVQGLHTLSQDYMVGLYAGFIHLALSGQLWWPPSGFQELLVQWTHAPALTSALAFCSRAPSPKMTINDE
jgi:hypothetical protein